MMTLEEMSARALTRGPGYPAIEWEKRWINWEEMRQIAERVNNLIEASGADPRASVAMVPRNRPNALAALVALCAAGRNVSMIHVYQSQPGVIRDILRLKPAVVIIGAEDFAEEIKSVSMPAGHRRDCTHGDGCRGGSRMRALNRRSVRRLAGRKSTY